MTIIVNTPAPSRASSMSEADPIVLGKKEAVHMTATTFAVVGASQNQQKYGWKIFDQLRKSGMRVFPINPNIPNVEGVTCLKTVSDLPDLSHTSISIVTQPAVTLQILQEISELQIKPLSVWIQPGATDDNCVKYISESTILSPICIYSRTQRPTPAPAPRQVNGALNLDTVSDGTGGTGKVGGCDAMEALVRPSIVDTHINVDGTIPEAQATLQPSSPTTSRAAKRARSPTPNPPTREVRPTKMAKMETSNGTSTQKTTAASTAQFPYDSTMLSKMTKFLGCSKFAVVGASATPTKMGTQILQAMLNAGKSVTVVNNNPNTKSVFGQTPIPDLSKLQDPSNTAVSMVIPPAPTLTVLQQIVDQNIPVPYIWLQPTTQDPTVIDFITNSPGLSDRCIWTSETTTGVTVNTTNKVGPCSLGPSALDLFDGSLTAWIPGATSTTNTTVVNGVKKAVRSLTNPCFLQKLHDMVVSHHPPV